MSEFADHGRGVKTSKNFAAVVKLPYRPALPQVLIPVVVVVIVVPTRRNMATKKVMKMCPFMAREIECKFPRIDPSHKVAS